MKTELYDSILSRCEGAVNVFDADVLRERTAKIRAAMPENVSLCYAVKANTFIIKELIGSATQQIGVYLSATVGMGLAPSVGEAAIGTAYR